jgi:hypothetical protein
VLSGGFINQAAVRSRNAARTNITFGVHCIAHLEPSFICTLELIDLSREKRFIVCLFPSLSGIYIKSLMLYSRNSYHEEIIGMMKRITMIQSSNVQEVSNVIVTSGIGPNTIRFNGI